MQGWNEPQKPSLQASAVTQAASSNNAAKYAAFVVGGVILGVLIAWGAGSWRGAPVTTTAGTTSKTTTVNTDNTPVLDASQATIAAGSNPSLLVMSPQAPGTSVAISKAIVAEPTWVVVYESTAGSPGRVLGAALFFPEHQQGTVELLRATVSGHTYLVAKRVDNGDHKFSLKNDLLLREGGEVQWVSFDVK